MATMNPEKRLTKEERATLCSRVDFLALLGQDGAKVERSGDHYLCSIRDEKTPSCHVYPPGIGNMGARGWTFADYPDSKAGDVLTYLVDVRRMPFVEAVYLLADLSGYRPPWMNTTPEEYKGKAYKPCSMPEGATVAPQDEPKPKMATEAQQDAVGAFLDALLDVHPKAGQLGNGYLASRGVLPKGWPFVAYDLPADVMPALLARVLAHEKLADMVEAGLVKPAENDKPLGLQWGPWAGNVCLIVHYDRKGQPMALIGRRLDFKAGDKNKYLQQTYSRGAVRIPMGLPVLYGALGNKRLAEAFPLERGPGRADVCLLAEGTLDALGAVRLGWPALAFSMRPEARDYETQRGACPQMLAPHLPALRRMREVLVMPDNDPGEKGAVGQEKAAALVGWLRAAGCKADLATMETLFPDLAAECKDLADAAKKIKDAEL